MAKVKLAKQLLVAAENKVGMLAEVSAAVSGAGVNIQGINAYAVDNKAYFRLLTDNNAKVKEVLQGKGYEVKEQEAVLVELPNQVGVLKAAADKLKSAGIDLSYIYGTTCSCGGDCLLVFGANNNAQAQKALS
ncbi:MAG: ACT domain-containing protein [Candidatus Omnitrophica bacterium]|nr:ACT domain-containing protein [Candidatus Omnitrophota bacterium]